MEEFKKQLYKKYPLLFPKEPICGFYCGLGWTNILSNLFGKINEEVLKQEDQTIFIVDQVKEKFGGLRVYMLSTTEQIERLIEEAVDKSFETCERCGKPGKPQGKHWIITLCDGCCNSK